MFCLRLIAIGSVGIMLSGCAMMANGLDASLGGAGTPDIAGSFAGLNLGGAATPSLPSTDAYVKQQLAQRGI